MYQCNDARIHAGLSEGLHVLYICLDNMGLVHWQLVDCSCRQEWRELHWWGTGDVLGLSYIVLWIPITWKLYFYYRCWNRKNYTHTPIMMHGVFSAYSCYIDVRVAGWCILNTMDNSIRLIKELRKHNNNDGKIVEPGWVCIPMVVETYGAWGVKAVKCFAQFCPVGI